MSTPLFFRPSSPRMKALIAKSYTLIEALALCSAIKVPPLHPPALLAPPTVPTTSKVSLTPTIPTITPTLRRSQRLLGNPPPPIPAAPPSVRHRTAKPAAPAARKGVSRVRKRIHALCKCKKGKEIAGPAPPTKIRLELTNKFSFMDGNAVPKLRMGFRYLGEDEEVAEGRSTLVLTLGTDIKGEELVGLDKMDVEVGLGFGGDGD